LSKDTVTNLFNAVAPNIKLIEKKSLRLLGSPILEESFDDFVEENVQNFCNCLDRLQKINSHMAYNIIKYCLFVPKFTYVLRCCQLWKYPILLQKLDDIVKHTLVSIINIPLDNRSWSQASLPIRLGGLGIRKISCVSLPAFLSSVNSTKSLANSILAPSLGITEISHLTEALIAWQIACPNGDLAKDRFFTKTMGRAVQ